MPKDDFFGKITSFEEALRKFEEALEQSESGDTASLPDIIRRAAGQAQSQRQPAQAQQMQWQDPAATELYMSGDQSVVINQQNAYADSIDDDRVYRGSSVIQDTRPQGRDSSNSNVDIDWQEGPLASSEEHRPIESSLTTYESDPTGLSALSNLNIENEASMLWWDDSEGSAAVPQALAALQRRHPFVQGVIWSEVLGRPVSRRRGQGRRNF